jgi:hypothetical protein
MDAFYQIISKKMQSCRNIVSIVQGNPDQCGIPDWCGGTGFTFRTGGGRYYFGAEKVCSDTGPGVYMRS